MASVDMLRRLGGQIRPALMRVLKSLSLLPWQLKWAIISHLKAAPGTCPCCGYSGPFRGFGNPVRSGAACPGCDALERHRLVALALQRGAFSVEGRDVLHFASEGAITKTIKQGAPRSYRTSSYPSGDTDLHLNLEAIDLPNESVDVVIASHILEHVDDSKAIPEIARILRPGGTLIAMVPIVEGWMETYENAEITSEKDREHHFGQGDHVRFYGADFRDRITSAGLALSEFTAGGDDSVVYRLQRGEKVFVGTKH